MVASKKKGSSFERWFSKELSLWWTNGERDDVFWRSASSGGRATQREKRGKKTAGQYGDVAATDPIGDVLLRFLMFELKVGYPDVSVQELLENPELKGRASFSRWLDQASMSAASSYSAYWALVTKRNRRKPIIWFPKSCFVLLKKLKGRKTTPDVIRVEFQGMLFVGMGLEEWFKWCTPSLIKQAERKERLRIP